MGGKPRAPAVEEWTWLVYITRGGELAGAALVLATSEWEAMRRATDLGAPSGGFCLAPSVPEGVPADWRGRFVSADEVRAHFAEVPW